MGDSARDRTSGRQRPFRLISNFERLLQGLPSVDPYAGAPFYIPIVRNAFAQKVVQAVPVKHSLLGKTDLYYRGWDLNTPDQYRFRR